MVEEHAFTCPYCWAEITMLLDLSVEEQTYIEDCEVCCRPIELHFAVTGDEVVRFEARIIP